MIKITVVKNAQNILSVEAVGHSGYAEAGFDIVCSAVSSLLIGAVNGLTEIVKANVDYEIDENKPRLYVSVENTMQNKFKDAQIIMKTLVLSLKGVADEQKKFICIKEKQHDKV